jgi:peroxiredoxin
MVGSSVDDSLVQFIPPGDATQVEQLFFGPKSIHVGEDIPFFELKGVDGRLISSSALRGQVVLLQFGSSSSADALLGFEMMYRSLKASGLTAIYVLNSQDRGKVSEAFTMPLAIDADGTVAKKFGISNNGMVLINRLGKIVYAYGLDQNSVELVQALRTVGVW